MVFDTLICKIYTLIHYSILVKNKYSLLLYVNEITLIKMVRNENQITLHFWLFI